MFIIRKDKNRLVRNPVLEMGSCHWVFGPLWALIIVSTSFCHVHRVFYPVAVALFTYFENDFSRSNILC